MGKRIEVTVVVVAGNDLDEVCYELCLRGMSAASILPEVGVISGEVDSDLLVELKTVPGVLAVQGGKTVKIAPPDSDIQ